MSEVCYLNKLGLSVFEAVEKMLVDRLESGGPKEDTVHTGYNGIVNRES